MRTSTLRFMGCFLTLAISGAAAHAAVILLGVGTIDGTALDKSGQTGRMLVNALEGPIPNATFGSAGSGIDYTGVDNIYLMCADRGPNNGDSTFLNRVHAVRITVAKGALKAEIVETHMLLSAKGGAFTGASGAFVGNPRFAGAPLTETLRLDPEAVRVMKDGTFWLSDEYGPYVLHFDRTGRQIGAFGVPAKYAVKTPSDDAARELVDNTMGRQSNRGMEGLALTPAGKLVGLMQSPLLQDHGLDASGKRIGELARILVMNPADGSTAEYVYPMDSNKGGMNEILAIDEHQFLVIERDNKAGADAKEKKIYKIDLSAATDISKSFSANGAPHDYTGSTPTNGLPVKGPVPGVKMASKSLLLDLLNPEYHLAGADLPEKMEGLAWGPDFDNGDKLLIVTTDNDFITTSPTYFYAFRISADSTAAAK